MTPTIKAPKMAWTPIISVTNADVNTKRRVKAIIGTVGPFTWLLVLIISFNSNGLTRKIRIRPHKIVRRKT